MDQMRERTDQTTTVQMPEIQIQIAETQAPPQFEIMLHRVPMMALDGAKITLWPNSSLKDVKPYCHFLSASILNMYNLCLCFSLVFGQHLCFQVQTYAKYKKNTPKIDDALFLDESEMSYTKRESIHLPKTSSSFDKN